MTDSTDRSERERCHLCGGEPSCVGAYEGNRPALACDGCCGHGNEDGWCVPLESARVVPVYFGAPPTDPDTDECEEENARLRRALFKSSALLVEADSDLSWMLHRSPEHWDENRVNSTIASIRDHLASIEAGTPPGYPYKLDPTPPEGSEALPPTTAYHPGYGPCDGFGPDGTCSYCRDEALREAADLLKRWLEREPERVYGLTDRTRRWLAARTTEPSPPNYPESHYDGGRDIVEAQEQGADPFAGLDLAKLEEGS